MNPYMQGLVSGLMNGATYALLGIGLVLVFRTSRVLNLAHGETFVVAAVLVHLLNKAGWPLLAAIPAAGAVAAFVYWSLQHFALRKRAGWSLGALILITLGAAFVARGVLILAIGTEPISFAPVLQGPPLRLLGAVIPRQGLLLIVAGFGVCLALTYFISRTRLGKELTATAENPMAAQLLGINIQWTQGLAYVISGILGALAAFLLVPLTSIDYQSGLSLTIRGFIAASVAGMLPGRTVLAGLFLGILESMVAVVFGALMQDPVIFGLLIGIAVYQSRKIRYGGGVRA